NLDTVTDFAEPRDYFLEDVDRVAIDETVLFHLINAVRQSGRTLLLTSRQGVRGLHFTLPDLASRLRAAAIVTISAPDDDLLEGVLRKLMSDRQLTVDEATIQYLVVRMERSLAAAGRLAAELDKLALVEKRAITRPLAARVLETLGRG
ncbi:MAG: DnaA/Hda family protein, partial [Pseudomonadota bacterium]